MITSGRLARKQMSKTQTEIPTEKSMFPTWICLNSTFLRTPKVGLNSCESHEHIHTQRRVLYRHLSAVASATATRGRCSDRSIPVHTTTTIRSYPDTSEDTAASSKRDCGPSASAAAPACGSRTGPSRRVERRSPALPFAIPADQIPSTAVGPRQDRQIDRLATSGRGNASPRIAVA